MNKMKYNDLNETLDFVCVCRAMNDFDELKKLEEGFLSMS